MVAVAVAVACAAEHASAGFVFTEVRRRVSASFAAADPAESQFMSFESFELGEFDEFAVVVDSDGFGYGSHTSSITSDAIEGQIIIAGKLSAPDLGAGGLATLEVVFRLDETTTVFASSQWTREGQYSLGALGPASSYLYNNDNPSHILAGGDSITFGPQELTLPAGEYSFGLGLVWGVSDLQYGFARVDVDFELRIVPAPGVLTVLAVGAALPTRRRRRLVALSTPRVGPLPRLTTQR